MFRLFSLLGVFENVYKIINTKTKEACDCCSDIKHHLLGRVRNIKKSRETNGSRRSNKRGTCAAGKRDKKTS